MAVDLSARHPVTSGTLPGSANGACEVPRLRLMQQVPPNTRRNWAGTLGNTLLEAPWAAWCLFDAVVVTLGIYFGYRYFVWTPEGAWITFPWWQTCIIQCVTMVLSALVFGLYEQQTLLRRSRIIARSVLTIGLSISLAYLVISLLMYSLQSRRVLFLAATLYLIVTPTIRLLVCWCVPNYGRRFIIVGTDRKSRLKPAGHGDGLCRRYQLVGYVALDGIEVGREIDEHRVLGTVDDLERICLEYGIDEVVVGPASARNSRALERTLSCLRLGCRVTNLSTFYEQVLSEVPVDHLEPNWFLFADLKHYRETQLIIKRAFDILGAVIGLILTLPFWPLIALLIKLDSQGPVFYSHIRVGLNGRAFPLHKFRTMYAEAEQDGHKWASVDDPRITRVGWYLRKTRIDELPQLWNILLGQMSIVGPRPERPEFVAELAPQIRFYNERHLIKPGLTGWAQINYRYGASVNDARRKLQLDLWYIKHMSLDLDLSILLRTMGTLCLGAR